MRVAARLLIAGTLIGASGTPLAAQAPPDPFATLPPVPPPTALEAFSPSDTLVTMGYTELGGVAAGSAIVRVDVRELRTASGDGVRGVTVDVIESQTRRDRSFLDVDEIAPLLRGIDAMLEVRANPTSFDRYELRYVTRGELWLRTVVTPRDAIVYAMQVGRAERAQAQLEVADLVKLRGLFAAAAAKLGAP